MLVLHVVVNQICLIVCIIRNLFNFVNTQLVLFKFIAVLLLSRLRSHSHMSNPSDVWRCQPVAKLTANEQHAIKVGAALTISQARMTFNISADESKKSNESKLNMLKLDKSALNAKSTQIGYRIAKI